MNSSLNSLKGSDAETRADAGAITLTRAANWLIAVYLAAVLFLMVVLRVTPSVDVFAAMAAIGALVLGRGLRFIRDWGPFVLIFMAWSPMTSARGKATTKGRSTQ